MCEPGPMQGFGARLKARGRELGLSDSEIARRLGLSQPRYASYTVDAAEPDLATLSRICRALDVTPDEVLGFADTSEPEPKALPLSQLAAAARSLDPARLDIAVVLLNALAGMPKA